MPYQRAIPAAIRRRIDAEKALQNEEYLDACFSKLFDVYVFEISTLFRRFSKSKLRAKL